MDLAFLCLPNTTRDDASTRSQRRSVEATHRVLRQANLPATTYVDASRLRHRRSREAKR